VKRDLIRVQRIESWWGRPLDQEGVHLGARLAWLRIPRSLKPRLFLHNASLL
jgi:hypothetical protein